LVADTANAGRLPFGNILKIDFFMGQFSNTNETAHVGNKETEAAIKIAFYLRLTLLLFLLTWAPISLICLVFS